MAVGRAMLEVNQHPPAARRQHLNDNWTDQQLAAALWAVDQVVVVGTVASYY